jgi:hypothetical protein
VQLPRHCEGEPEMTELQILARNTQALKELLRVAWRDLANPMLTPFERREARNQINQYAADLRHHLALMEAEQRRLREQSAARSESRGFEMPNFRILA